LAAVCLICAALLVEGLAQADPTNQAASAPAHDAGVPGPVSLTLEGSELEARRITSLGDVPLAAPALTLTPSFNSNTTPILYMRGQGLDNPAQITRDGAVGVYEDGFYIGRPQAVTFDMPDLGQVEVLSGPQGALYGRNTTGGVINLVSRVPSGDFRLIQSADIGNRGMFRVLASVDTPRWHDLSASMTLLASSIDGDVKNPLPNSHDFGEERQRGGRLRLRWDGLPGVQADYFLEKSAVDSTPAYDTNPSLNGDFIFSPFLAYEANPDGPTTTAYRPVNLPLSTSSHLAQGLTLTWRPSAGFGVRSLTGYRVLDAVDRQDYAEFLGLASRSEDLYRHHQFSQQLQLTGELWERQLSYLVEVTYFKEGGWHNRAFQAIAAHEVVTTLVFADTRSESAALELRWQPAFAGRRLELTAAGRYTRDTKDAERFESDTSHVYEEDGALNHLGYRRVNPSFTLSYRWMKELTTYATAATGFRAGGALETAAVGEFTTGAFQPESLLTYEVGLKSASWNDRLRANLAAFTSRYRNIQYPISVDRITDQVYTLGQATIRGADLSLVLAPTQDLALSARGTFLHWKIDTAEVLPRTLLDPASGSGSTYSVGESVNDLFALPFTPKYNFTVASDYTFLRLFRRTFSAHLDYVYRGQFYSDAASGSAVPGRQFATTPPVQLLNARLDLLQETDRSHHVKMSLWGRNVLNRKYYQLARGYGAGLSQFTTSDNGPAAPEGWKARAGAWAEPATYGVSFSYQY
jgi:iron complex outermembrane receptor protein